MSDDDEQLGRLYRTAISQLPGGRPDPVRARTTAVRRRHRRRAAAAVAVTAAVAALVAVGPRWGEPAAVTAAPAGGSQPAACPSLLPGTSNAAADYANLLTWNGHTYLDRSMFVDRPKAARLGPQVTTITCSIPELTAGNGNRVADGHWPDGTATVLASGTPVYAVVGFPERCALGVRDPTPGASRADVTVFVAVSEPSWEPVC